MELDGKTLAILLCDQDREEVEVFCHTGRVRRSETGYEFYREDGSVSLNLRTEWIGRIQPVPDTVKEILLDADLVLSLTVGTIPDGTDLSLLEATGLKIPPHE